MEINKVLDGNKLIIELSGQLNTTTSPSLDEEINTSVTNDITDLVFDFKDLTYVSSAGLRVILISHQKMTGKGGTFTIINVCDDIKEVFNMTGFSTILNIED